MAVDSSSAVEIRAVSSANWLQMTDMWGCACCCCSKSNA